MIMPQLYGQKMTTWSTQPSLSGYYMPLKLNRYASSSLTNPGEKYFENNTNISISFPLNNKLRLGVAFNSIATRVLREPVDRSGMAEAFFQYNLTARRKLGVYLQGGYAFGKFCPCGEEEAFTSNITNHFLPFGFGLNYPLFDIIHIKAGFINYKPLKGHEELYNWTQPYVGINIYFLKNYKVPFKSRFKERNKIIPKKDRNVLWIDENVRKWNIGISSAGIQIKQTENTNAQPTPVASRKYLEFVIVPRINYWLNQAILIGLQGSFYHYEDDYDLTTPKANGLGVGAQFKLFPLSLKNPKEFRAIRIGKRANWNISPTIGVEVHTANFSWLEPELAGQKWEYFDFQPNVGFVLSYKKLFNLFWSAGPALGVQDIKKTRYTNGLRVIGLEYNFMKK